MHLCMFVLPAYCVFVFFYSPQSPGPGAAARERKYAGLDSTASHPRASCLRRGTSSRSLEFAPTHPRRVQYEGPVATACHPWMSCFYILTLLRFLPIPAAQRHEGPDANALHRLFLPAPFARPFCLFFYIPFRCRFFAIPLFACCSLQSAVVYAPFDSPRSCSNTLPPLTQLLCFPTVYHLPPFPPYSGYLRYLQADAAATGPSHAWSRCLLPRHQDASTPAAILRNLYASVYVCSPSPFPKPPVTWVALGLGLPSKAAAHLR